MARNKGQLFGQIFVYIMAIIIVSALLLFGYKAIKTFTDKSEDVALLQLKKGLESTVKSISLDYGSVSVKKYSLPSGIKKVCFVHSFPEMPRLSSTSYPLIEDSVNSKVDKNVFLLSDSVADSFSIGPIAASEPLLCIDAVGIELTVRFEGKGNHAYVSR